jgi:hypothetical protein
MSSVDRSDVLRRAVSISGSEYDVLAQEATRGSVGTMTKQATQINDDQIGLHMMC